MLRLLFSLQWQPRLAWWISCSKYLGDWTASEELALRNSWPLFWLHQCRLTLIHWHWRAEVIQLLGLSVASQVKILSISKEVAVKARAEQQKEVEILTEQLNTANQKLLSSRQLAQVRHHWTLSDVSWMVVLSQLTLSGFMCHNTLCVPKASWL